MPVVGLQSAVRSEVAAGGAMTDDKRRRVSAFNITDSAPVTPRGRPRAVVIDDDQLIRTVVSRVLMNAGYDVETGADGVSAIRLAQSLPDVVVLDMNLPDVSGIAVCRAIRNNVNTQDVPIVVLTGAEDARTSISSFQAGADDFVRKPFVDEVLVLRVNRIVSAQLSESSSRERLHELGEAYRALGAARADMSLKHRLSGLGILTAGLAHEMNSPLGALIASLQFVLEDKTATSDDVESALTDAMTASQRIAELVRRMRSIAGSEDRTRTDVNLRQRCELIVDAFPSSTNISLSGPEILVSAVDNEIREALLALIDNAVRAATATGKPDVRISLEIADDSALVTVDDNGAGIDERDLPYIFDPFFTRHRALRGKGLGLSLALAAVRRHGGSLIVEPHGHLGGCRARLSLPLIEGRPEETVSGIVLLREFVAAAGSREDPR